MKNIFTNITLISVFSILFGIISLVASIKRLDVEWFQASGAIITVCGVLLTARKLIRLGIKEYTYQENVVDLGHIVSTQEETEKQNQENADIRGYRVSIYLLISGTLIWAYGGILLRAVIPELNP